MAWDELKREAMNKAVKNLVGGLYGEPDEPLFADIQVKKKETLN